MRILHLIFLALGLSLVAGCSSSKTKFASVESSSSDGRAELAVKQTTDDERMAPQIQREMSELFFQDKKVSPGGLDAFSDERLSALEQAMKESKSPAIRYFLENRRYFERLEDAGGGFRIVVNGKRLLPVLKTKAGRAKLFQMDYGRVREMTAHPCFSAIEDCGEDSSDGEENTTLLDQWVKKYPENEFQMQREKLLRSYLAALGGYEKKIALKQFRSDRLKKEALLMLGTHRRSVESLLESR